MLAVVIGSWRRFYPVSGVYEGFAPIDYSRSEVYKAFTPPRGIPNALPKLLFEVYHNFTLNRVEGVLPRSIFQSWEWYGQKATDAHAGSRPMGPTGEGQQKEQGMQGPGTR